MPGYLKWIFALFIFSLTTAIHASPITISTDFVFDSFSDLTSSGNTPPFSSISGSFTLTFDPTVEVTDAEVTSISFDDPLLPFSTTGIRYTNTINTSGSLTNFLLDIYSTDLAVLFNTDDFLIRLAGLPSNGIPGAGQMLYAVSGMFTAFGNNTATVLNTTVSNPSSSVPEPAPVVLLALGILGLLVRKTGAGRAARGRL